MPRAVAAIILVGVSAAHIQAVEDTKPAVRLKGVSVKRIDWKDRTAETELSISIDNPGPAFKLKDLSYRLKLNDQQAGEGKCERGIEVAAHSSTTVNLPGRVDLSALPGVAWGIIAGGFDVHYELETEFTVPFFPLFTPRMKSSIAGDLSLAGTVSGWTAKLKERISRE
ncbi:MAG: LEA type 2 family protein [Acidobacteriota bacterium]